jgi:hypothetical protein
MLTPFSLYNVSGFPTAVDVIFWPNEVIEMIANMVKTGTAWSLQGSYGRIADAFIFNEAIDNRGNILIDLKDYDN